ASEDPESPAIGRKIFTHNPFGVSDLSKGDRNLKAEELLNYPRVQMFSIPKSEGKEKSHDRLEEMRKEDPRLSYYPSIVVSENKSKWNRGQIGPFKTLEEAEEVAKQLRLVFTQDLPCVSKSGW